VKQSGRSGSVPMHPDCFVGPVGASSQRREEAQNRDWG
jgi:hypothetical protein